MMDYLFIPLWAAFQIGFARAFLASFLEIRCRKEEAFWVTMAVWLLTALYGLFRVEGIYGYLMYLLSAVLLVLAVYGESGGKGLGLLVFVFLIPVAADLVIRPLGEGIVGLGCYITVTVGKVLPLLSVRLLRRTKRFSPRKREQSPERDMLLLRQHMEMQQESMGALEASFRAQRKSAHEFEHHIQVLRDLLDRGEVEAAREYLDRLKKNRSILVTNVSSNHPVIDVILNQKYRIAQENEIKMQIQVNDLSAVDIPTDSLVVVLTNLLDNAIEACRRLEGYREIFCSLLYEEGLYISIRNTSEEVEVVDGKIPTSKADSLSHGFGLMSVTYVLDQLEAEYTFGYSGGWFHFAAEIG